MYEHQAKDAVAKFFEVARKLRLTKVGYSPAYTQFMRTIKKLCKKRNKATSKGKAHELSHDR